MEPGRAGPEGRRGSSGRGGAAGALCTLLVLAAVVAALAWVRFRRDQRAAEPIEPPPELWVDPAAARLEAAPGWADPRWIEELRAHLAHHAPFPVDAAERLALLESDLAALSFVERVDACRASAAAGLEL